MYTLPSTIPGERANKGDMISSSSSSSGSSSEEQGGDIQDEDDSAGNNCYVAIECANN